MKFVPIGEIVISPERQRQEFDPAALIELRESIEGPAGLMHPIVIREGNRLVAGERRLRAIADIYGLAGSFLFEGKPVPEGCVPAVDLGELSPDDAEEAELHENIRRRDLTWQEHAAAVERLHRLRTSQTGGTQTLKATTEEVYGPQESKGWYQQDVRQKIVLASHLDDPDVAKAKTAADAFKILLRKEEAATNRIRSATVGATYSAASHTLIHGDCCVELARLPHASFDVVITDPPYGMGADSFGDAAGRLTSITHGYDDSLDSFEDLMHRVLPLISLVAKPGAHLYLCCDIDQFHWLRSLVSRSDYGSWTPFRTPLINVKSSGGRVPLPEHGPRRCYETILYAFRGGRRTTSIQPDVISTAGDENLGHGAQKPVELYRELLRRSTRPGDSVIDPFAGTGTVFVAAHDLQLYATGIERDDSYHGIALKRLQSLDGAGE